jgi:zinc protease
MKGRLPSPLLVLAAVLSAGCAPAASPDTSDLRPVGRAAVDALTYPPLVFDPPAATEHEVLGVPVYHLHDPALPLVDVYVQLQGGPSHFPRDELALLTGLPTFIRNGGTQHRPPDEVDRELDLLALELRVSRGGTGSLYALNTLEDAVDDGLALLGEILLEPAFDPEALEVWRGQELERIRRRLDAPQSLAFEEFNRLMFGDHPVGWVMDEADLAPERLAPEQIRATHRRLYCRDRVILGVAGSLTWADAEPRVRAFLQEWPACEEELPERPEPRMRDEGGIFILERELEQTVIVMAHPGGIRQEDSPEFFASRVADLVLGGAGFTSRLMARVRTERGLAYGASSLWTAPVRHEGLVGAVTATGAERTVEAVGLVLEIMEDFRDAPPSPEEVQRAVDQIANGYVFAFESARQIVARRMGDRLQELPEGWLERYLEGIQAVSPEDVHEVARRYIDPGRMTILLVGDPERFDDGLDALGPLYRLHLDGSWEPWDEG